MALPNFLIVGAAKSGTTSLYHYLRQHPQVFMPEQIKETLFFCGLTARHFPGPGGHYADRAVETWEEYKQLFGDAGACIARGEACVAYLYFHRATISRILEHLGRDVKIVISLRNPVDRAYSNYLHHVRDGIEPLALEEALESAPQRQTEGWWWGFQYVDLGRYYEQVKAYWDTFGGEQIQVLLYEDLATDTGGVVQRLFQFLEVEDTFRPHLSLRYNATGVPRHRLLHDLLVKPNPIKEVAKKVLPIRLRAYLRTRYYQDYLVKPPLSSETRNRLAAAYREDVLKLQALIQRDLSHWLCDPHESR